MAISTPPVFKDTDAYKPGDIIISAKQIEERFDELVPAISKYYIQKHVLIVGILNGAAWVAVDLLKRLHAAALTDLELTFMKVASYTTETKPVYEPRIELDVSINPRGRHVLIVDDILDTGRTLTEVERILKGKESKTIKCFVLLDKAARREVPYRPSYCGFVIPNIWVQGRGMDSNGYGRGDPNIIKGPYKY